MSACNNPKVAAKYKIKQFTTTIGNPGGLEGWDEDLFCLITDLYQYIITLEEKMEKLECAHS